MNDILVFLGAGSVGLLLKHILFKNEVQNEVQHNREINLSNLKPDTKLIENEEGKSINSQIEKGIFTPVFINPLNAKELSPTKGVHISVPGLMPASNDTWKDDEYTVYYMPNDKKPHLHGDAPHHQAMFEIDQVFEMSIKGYRQTENKKIAKYRNKSGIIKFNNGESNTPVEVWIHWRIPYNQKEYPTLIVRKNSIVWWDFTEKHNLFLVDTEDNYKQNKFNNSKKISDGYKLQTLVTFMDKVGTFYFACTVIGHAKMGHKIIIKVIE